MTSFAALNRSCSRILADVIQPFAAAGPAGHLWTARLETAAVIERIYEWIDSEALDLFEIAQAQDLRTLFARLPTAGFTVTACTAALRDETARWTGKPAN